MSWGCQFCTTLQLTVIKPQAMVMGKILEKFLGILLQSNDPFFSHWFVFDNHEALQSRKGKEMKLPELKEVAVWTEPLWGFISWLLLSEKLCQVYNNFHNSMNCRYKAENAAFLFSLLLEHIKSLSRYNYNLFLKSEEECLSGVLPISTWGRDKFSNEPFSTSILKLPISWQISPATALSKCSMRCFFNFFFLLMVLNEF